MKYFVVSLTRLVHPPPRPSLRKPATVFNHFCNGTQTRKQKLWQKNCISISHACVRRSQRQRVREKVMRQRVIIIQIVIVSHCDVSLINNKRELCFSTSIYLHFAPLQEKKRWILAFWLHMLVFIFGYFYYYHHHYDYFWIVFAPTMLAFLFSLNFLLPSFCLVSLRVCAVRVSFILIFNFRCHRFILISEYLACVVYSSIHQNMLVF